MLRERRDRIRSDAYSAAYSRLRGRPGLLEGLTENDIAQLLSYSGPEIVGSLSDLARKPIEGD